MSWLRDKARAWLGVYNAPAPVDNTPKAMTIEPSTFNRMLANVGELNVIHRNITPPQLPEAVRGGFVYDAANDPGKLGPPMLAMDDAANAPAWAYLNQNNCGLAFPGYGYLSELSQRSEYRSPVETVASEITREWIKIVSKGKEKAAGTDDTAEDLALSEEKPKEVDADGDGDVDGGLEDKIQQLEEAMEEFQVRDHFRRIAEVDGFFGRAQLFINIESKNPDEDRQLPLVVDSATIKQGSLLGFKVIEPIWTTPYNYNSTDPTRADFYKPRAWFVIGKRTHASRLLTFVSREVADILKPAYNFGGLSMSQLMEPYVFQWLRTRNSVSNLVHNFSVMCLKTDMVAVLTGDPGAGQGLLDRARLFTQTRDNQGLTLLDKTREELEQVAVPLANLDKLQAQSQEHMAAPSHLPMVKLTGVTPAGLNASSEGEIQVWYDHAAATQESFFGKHLKHVLQILQLHKFGEIDDAIGFEWVPLSTPTTKELSEIRKSDAETDAIYIDKGVISPEESRERVGGDPNSGFDNLSGPAPEPPDILGAEHGAGLQEEGAQADHARTMEQQAAAAKAKAKDKPPAKKN